MDNSLHYHQDITVAAHVFQTGCDWVGRGCWATKLEYNKSTALIVLLHVS